MGFFFLIYFPSIFWEFSLSRVITLSTLRSASSKKFVRDVKIQQCQTATSKTSILPPTHKRQIDASRDRLSSGAASVDN